MADIQIKRGNHYPNLHFYPVWPSTVPDPMPDWSSATAQIIIRLPGSGSPVLVLTCTSFTPPPARDEEGEATYVWPPTTPSQTETPTAGIYDCELEVTLATGKRVTFPNGGYNSIEFVEKLST